MHKPFFMDLPRHEDDQSGSLVLMCGRDCSVMWPGGMCGVQFVVERVCPRDDVGGANNPGAEST